MIKIIDNFLSESYFDCIKNICLHDIRWIFSDNISDSKLKSISQIGFCHPIHNSEGFVSSPLSPSSCGLLFQMMDVTKTKKILRSRCDMTVFNENKLMHLPHIDMMDPYISNITTIFYITNNIDSETLIFDKLIKSKEDVDNLNLSDLKVLEKIDPKENRLVIFDGSYLHTGHSPTHENRRILINTNFLN